VELKNGFCSVYRQLRHTFAGGQRETAGGPDALSRMGLLIGVTAFALVLGFGLAIRKQRQSRTRRRSYYHSD
jgi:hypothetical protein